jgi:hypothetical protein
MTLTALAPASTAGLFGTMGSAHCSSENGHFSSILGRGSGAGFARFGVRIRTRKTRHDHLHLSWSSRGL